MRSRIVGPVVLGIWLAWIVVPILLSFFEDGWSTFRLVMLLLVPWAAVPSHWGRRVRFGRVLQGFGIALLLLLPIGGVVAQVPVAGYLTIVAPVLALPFVWLSNRRWSADLRLQSAAS
ncbi:hypothetical protein E1263_34310 [Kribbella antibiotica]|uniref:Uncharacterized protein n=1 Tax=Kribbella antibiotica TaxID=190195 RepID=A0A4R4YT37_9ACTN|nr:hypothetical protein [Kribbella antibiotica]TDD47574.1 hypothetical protein E1263_34310 [Kribbella antibiotica]